MSAQLVDDLVEQSPSRLQPNRWRHVEHGPQARPHLVVLPGGRPSGVAAPTLRAAVAPVRRPAPAVVGVPLRLTDRGIAVVLALFLAIFATAAVVLVSSFLAISNDPIPAVQPTAVVMAAQG